MRIVLTSKIYCLEFHVRRLREEQQIHLLTEDGRMLVRRVTQPSLGLTFSESGEWNTAAVFVHWRAH